MSWEFGQTMRSNRNIRDHGAPFQHINTDLFDAGFL